MLNQGIKQAVQLLQQKKFEEASQLLEKFLEETQNDNELGLAYSLLGLISKHKKDFKKAWKHYDQAEKKIPDDPALKIISARLLIDYFGQYETVLHKLSRFLKKQELHPVFLQPIKTMMGVCHLKLGQKNEGIQVFKETLDLLDAIKGEAVLDFSLVEEMARKKLEPNLVQLFFEKAKMLVKKNKDLKMEKKIEKALGLFKQMNAANSK